MNTELKAVENLLQEWKVFLETTRNKKKEAFFNDPTDFHSLEDLFKNLSISSSMTVGELKSALEALESIAVIKPNSPRSVPLHEILEEKKYRTFNKHYGTAEKRPCTRLVVAENSPLHQFLIKNQQMLLNYYERSHLQATGDLHFSEVNYSPAQLKESQPFFDMETTSLGAKLSDEATIVPDLRRGGVTLNNTKLNPEASNEDILGAIEDFSRDTIKQPNSRATKIFNFGGQFLQGVILKEFTNSTVFSDSHISGFEQGYVKSHIDWSKDDQRNYHATIKMKILTGAYADPNNPFGEQKLYAMSSDGSSLIEFGMDDPELMEKIIIHCKDELRGETENNITPICEINAKVKLVLNPDKKTKGFLLQMEEFQIQYNTSDLTSTKAPEYREPNRLSL